ncbi:CoA pyrophosphatase [Photobacterium swingsii]|uniref:CoA pyrophosphatase n=1 Tax=Photobacterium swingsii TaxID=680026 RepID=UPI003D13625D
MNQQQLLSRFILAPTADYDESHQLRVRQHIAAHSLTTQQHRSPFKPAAVLISLVPRNNTYNVVLTQRAHHLKHHPGQVAFPGGKKEHSDVDLIDTALRETYEETGIICNRDNILGQLPPLPTISGYVVTPYLSTISPHYSPTLDRNEVDSLFEVPLEYLINPLNIKSHKFPVNGRLHDIYSISFSKYSIWGATAQMIKILSMQLWHEI